MQPPTLSPQLKSERRWAYERTRHPIDKPRGRLCREVRTDQRETQAARGRDHEDDWRLDRQYVSHRLRIPDLWAMMWNRRDK